MNGADPPPTPNEEGVNYPSPDSRIQNQITDCPGADCTSGIPATITSAGTYYNGDGTPYSGTLVVDDPGGDVLVVVDGDFEPSDVIIEDVDSGNSVTVYVDGDYRMTTGGDRLNDDFDADPTEYRVFVHSSGVVSNNGNSGMAGVVLAPGSTCNLNGGGPPGYTNIEGSIVCDTIDINGNPNDFQYDPAVQGMNLGISNAGTIRLQYLHVSTTEVKVTSG